MSNEIASRVKSVQANGTWESKAGQVYYRFDYEMEDGTVLQASHIKPENALKVDDKCYYEVTREHPTYGKSGKVKHWTDGQTPPKNRQKDNDLNGIKVGHAINNAVQIAIAMEDFEMETIENIAMDILKLSEEINDRIDGSN